MRMDGKVVVLTGGAGFLGGHFTRALTEAGARVVVFDKNVVWAGVGLKNMSSKLVDITDPVKVREAVGEIVKEYGGLDALINNAAMNPVPGTDASKKQFAPYEDYDLELWREEIEVGITGSQICIQEAVKVMKDHVGCAIVNIGSHYGLISPDHRIYPEGDFKSIAYATVKGAMLNFTRAWAGYLGKRGIRINCLVFGGVENGQDQKFVEEYSKRTMLGRMARVGEYNEGLIFLASGASSYMTGQTLVMDGGWTAL